MTKTLPIAVAASLLGAPALATDVSVETLREVADRFDRAQIGQDRATLERMTTVDFILIGTGGARQSRQQFIDDYFEPGLRFEITFPEDRYFIPLGPDAGIVGGDVVMRGTSNG